MLRLRPCQMQCVTMLHGFTLFFTVFQSRPFGVALLFAGLDENGPQL